jgi:mono/diheme cytochrome c family protein
MIRRLLLLLLAPSCFAAGPKTPPWEKQSQVLSLGEDLHREHCAVCHDVDKRRSKKPGPSLYRLFKNEKLPLSGGKPSREYVIVKIKFGGAFMPPFVRRMNDNEIAALVAYLETK